MSSGNTAKSHTKNNDMPRSLLQEATSLMPNLYGSAWENLRITRLWLQELYTIIVLNNGEIGVALNYDNEGFARYRRQYNPRAIESDLLTIANRDPLLLSTLFEGPNLTFCERSILCAILGALSRPFLESTSHQKSEHKKTKGMIALDSISRNGDKVHIVGFGGYLYQALTSPKFSQVYISDLSYGLLEGKRMIDRELKAHRSTFKSRSFFVYDGKDYGKYVQHSDIVIITGSALCNGSMEGLLNVANNAREVIIYGHSGVLLPSVYFARGATRLCWSNISSSFLEQFKARAECQNKIDGFANFIDSKLTNHFTIHSPNLRNYSRGSRESMVASVNRTAPIEDENLEGRTVLEVGSGRGSTTRRLVDMLMRQPGARLVATDVSDEFFQPLRDEFQARNIQAQFIRTSAHELHGISNDSVDFLVCNYTLCAVNSHAGLATLALRRFCEVLKSDGKLFVEEEFPIGNHNPPTQEIWAEKWRILKSAMILAGKFPYNEIAPETLEGLCQLAGFYNIQWTRHTKTFPNVQALDFFQERLDTLLPELPNDGLRTSFAKLGVDLREKIMQIGGMEVPFYRFTAQKCINHQRIV